MHPRKVLNVRLTLVCLWLPFAVCSLQAATKGGSTPALSVRATRASAVYRQGEIVRFEVQASSDLLLGTNAEVQWKISKDGVAPVTTGAVQLVDRKAVISGKLEEPGHLLCTVSVQVEGKPLTALAGAAVDPLLIKPSMSAPEDFDAFWSAQKQRVAAVPMNPQLKPVASGDTNAQCFDAQVDCAGGAPVSGYLAKPAGAKPKSLPAILLLHGAGVGSSGLGSAVGWAGRGFLAFDMNAHGLPNGQSPQFYKDLNEGALNDYSHKGRDSRESSYFLGMFLRVLRGIDFVAAQPEWDGKVLVAYGSSQGGFQAIAAGGLDERVSFIAAGVPAGCDHTGMAANRVSGWPKWVPLDANGKPAAEALQAARYFDAVNFASRTKAAGAFFTVGFIDQVCPATSVYAAYNNLPVPKQIYNDIPTAHANSPAAMDARNRAVLNHARPAKKNVAEWNPPMLKPLVAEVPRILAHQDTNTGRFKGDPWICDDQNVVFPLAVAWATHDPANPFYHDPRVLEAVMKGGDALVDAQDSKGMWEFRKRDNSTWGQTAQPWTYSRWVRAFQLIKDAMPPKRRQYWEKGLKLGFERIAKSLPQTRSHNKPCHLAMALYCAGICFDRNDWKQVAREFMAKVVAAQSPDGYWSEHSGPVVNYSFVYSDALGAYYSMSRDTNVLDSLRRAALFHTIFTYPSGTSVETIDERNPYKPGVRFGNVGFTLTPEGRALLARQFALCGGRVDADTAASFLLHGATGSIATAKDAEKLVVFGNKDALVLRESPWFLCFSAFTAPVATNRWIQDRQNFVSVFHEKAGLIAGGGNTKLQPLWSTFTVGNTSLLRHKPGDEEPDFRLPKGLTHVPDKTEIVPSEKTPALILTYGKQKCRVGAEVKGPDCLTLSYERIEQTSEIVEGHLTLVPPSGARVRTANGRSVKLGDSPFAWPANAVGPWLQYGNVRVEVPEGTKVLWPARRYNPYKKDGSSGLEEARLVLCLPLSASVPKREITLQVSDPEPLSAKAGR